MKSTKALYINLHKLLIIPLLLGWMFFYDNFSLEACIYLALHGSYSVLWFLKYLWFRDDTFRTEIPFLKGFFSIFMVMTGYYLAPFILISNHVKASPLLIVFVIFLYSIGIFFHYVSDVQKYFTLKYKKGLITVGMFSRTRNPNYFGEITMYVSFALFSKHWLPFIIILSFTFFVFLKIMKQKDQFLSQFPEFDAYKKRTWLLFPKFF